MRIFLAAAVLWLATFAATAAGAVTINFSFDADLISGPNPLFVPGTVRGRIVGLVDNASSGATHLYLDSFPAALGAPDDPLFAPGLDVTTWSNQAFNSFTLVDGVLTGFEFAATRSTDFGDDLFVLNLPFLSDAPLDLLSLGSDEHTYLVNLSGAGGVRFGSSSVPEPAAWALMIAGFGMVGVVARRGRIAHAA